MKKLLLFLFVLVTAMYARGQVNVSLQVDVTRLIAGGTTIYPAGMRVAGTFGTLNASVNGVPMKDWSPNDTTGALTSMGNNIWGIVVTFPDSDATNLDTLQFKFVDGTWAPTGTNEGANGDDSLILGGCANSGGNRVLAIPSANANYSWCYDHCTSCGNLAPPSPVTVNLQVDVTRLIAGGATIYPAGMRVAGTFGTLNASVNGVAMKDWSPNDTTGALTNLGNNIWGISITFPDSDAVKHDTLQFKFVDGTWAPTGTNEGANGDDSLILGGCANSGGNRVLAIPLANANYAWCYDHCTSCGNIAPPAPVNVNLQVDVTRLIAGGTTIYPAGMRIAGTFGTLNANVNGVAMKDWSPNDTTGALTNMGNNIWGITITFPDSDAVKHDTLQFKFVDGTWSPTGTNEGANGDDTLILGGCANSGGNRVLAIPSANANYAWCYDRCTSCSNLPPPSPVNVSLSVDVTRLIASGTTIYPAGMRVAGTFGTLNASVNGVAMKDWSPNDTTGKLANLGNNIWGVTITFPDSDAVKHDTLQFKFVDGTWAPTGTNEGANGDDSLILGGCANSGGNRVLAIPSSNANYSWCYDHCSACTIAPLDKITVTLQVDITRLIAEGTTIYPAGMRIAGTFGTLHAKLNGVAMVDWTPGDTSSRLTNIGNNIWATTITFPDSEALKNDTLQFKFVDGTWYSTGTNEGANTDDTLILEGCANSGGNRAFAIPAINNEVYQWCYDHCTRCDGSPALSSVLTGVKAAKNNVNVFSLRPNPAVNGQSTLMYSVNEYSQVSITLCNVLGQQVKTIVNTNRPSGIYNQTIDLSGLNAGIYFIQLTSGNQTTTRRIVLF